MDRDYQYNYSELRPSVFDIDDRSRKADTIVKVCQDFLQTNQLSQLTLLDVGSSSGIIDNYLADHFGTVHGIDIDEPAMAFARQQFQKPNLHFAPGDAMHLEHNDNSFDIVVCSHVYEHVPDASQLFSEIFRVLRPGGFCYFSGNNRLMLMEPHYKLPLLSVIPRPIAHLYMRMAGRGQHYHEQHVSYWSLTKLCSAFELHDYSPKIIEEPAKYGVDYMLKPGTAKWRIAGFVSRHLKWATPHVWLLRKPGV